MPAWLPGGVMSLLNLVDIPLAIVLTAVTSFQAVDLYNYNKGDPKITQDLKIAQQTDNLQVLAGPGGAPSPQAGVEIGATYVFGDNIAIWRPIAGMKYFYKPTNTSLSKQDRGEPTADFVWAGAGLQYEKELFRIGNYPVYLEFSAMLGPHYGTNRYRLGGPIAINETAGLAVDLNKSYRVSFSYDHISNGYTATPNFGLEGILLSVTYKF
jgi:Lipid A 3-O-deacylase (PagL)